MLEMTTFGDNDPFAGRVLIAERSIRRAHKNPPKILKPIRIKRIGFIKAMSHARHFFLLVVFLGVAGFFFATLLTFFLATAIIYLLESE